ncbi:MAG: alginate lyase family protein [Terriglobales bacterium]
MRPDCKIGEAVAGWHNKLARLAQMDWDEVRTRVAQEVHKRSELLLYRMGMRPRALSIDQRSSRQARFFFAPGDAHDRAALLRTHLPAEALEILHRADDICHHRFRLLGYDDLDYGDEIDWHLDRVHGKRAPLDPWFKIPFLQFAAVGDHKITWELNRHQHLVTLAKAWLLSKDEKYVRELIAQWHSWVKANPYPLGINWGSTLEVAFRSLSWIWVDQMLTDAPEYAELRTELLPALALHGRYIERYLSTYFSPNTHLLGEAVALFFLGTLYPQIAAAARWQRTGWKVVLQSAQRQVRPDGVYFEQSLHYHVYALDFFLYAQLLAARNGLEIPAVYTATMGRMLDVLQALSRAGPPEGFGDDDGGRVFNPRRNHTEHMTDPLAIGTLLYGREDLSAARLTEESIWLFGQQAVDALLQENAHRAPHSAAFPDGGFYVLADSQPYAQQMVVDAGPQGVGRCGHGHSDALSVRLTMDGQRWLVDAGSGVYISADPSDRNAFRGTGAHNTMRVDGVDQAVPADPFSWTAIPTTRVENWSTGKTFSYFAGSHDGYVRLPDPVTHCRYVAKINGGPCLVRDVALGREAHDLEVRWHFAPDFDLRETENGMLAAARRSGADSGQPSLRLILPEGTSWQMEMTRGLISPAYGKFQPAPLLRAHARVALPAEIATLLAPGSAAHTQDSTSRLVSMRHAAVQVYELVEQDANHGFYFALDKRAWNFGPWFSDAEFLYCRIEQEKLVHLTVVGGSYVAWQGQPLLKAPGPSAFFEWRKREAVIHAEPDRFSVSPLFQELTGGVTLSAETSNTTASTFAEKR